MNKARKSTIGSTALDSAESQIAAVLAPFPQKAKTVAPPAPAVVQRVEPKTKATHQRATVGRKTLTIDASVERTVYTREEAAAYIGTSPVTLWRLAKSGAVGHTLVGRRIRFLREDLDRYTRNEPVRPGALVGWAKDEERSKRMMQVHAERKAQN